ncbi:MAG: hypothetical protein H8E66_21745 [Planctomycetes bacterium]|nr:hypothetical protein [Planctomycetota bacterium]
MTDERDYEAWLERRRTIGPPSGFANHVMASVRQSQTAHKISLVVRLALWVERSRVTRYLACSTALLIGSTPFIFLAYFAQLIVF